MSKRLAGVGMLCVCGLFVLSACGGGDDKEIVPVTIAGQVGGCHIENGTTNIRVGVMGLTESGDFVELASSAVATETQSYSVTLSAEPPLSLSWVSLEGGSIKRTELMIYSYLDADADGAFGDADGDPLGAATLRIHFFTDDYDKLRAVYGFNVLDTSSGLYTQSFDTLSTQAVYVSTGTVCAEEETD